MSERTSISHQNANTWNANSRYYDGSDLGTESTFFLRLLGWAAQNELGESLR